MDVENFLCPITCDVMMDPVIAPDGITYERSAIAEWLSLGNRTSPVTREPLSSSSLIPNIALRTVIQDAIARDPTLGGELAARKAASTATPAAAAVAAARAAHTAPASAASAAATGPLMDDSDPTVSPPIAVSVTRVEPTVGSANGDEFHVQLAVREKVSATLPAFIVHIVDISGSMGQPSVDASTVTSEAAQFSRSDLVRHAVATQIELLRAEDQLAIVLFDDRFSVALPPTRMNATGKTAARAVLPQIDSFNGTNIWGGLKCALDLVAEASTAGYNVSLILQTDGESDPQFNPPRGIPAAFTAWQAKHADLHFSLHTVGYGYGRGLDTPLLGALARAGHGSLNYVPDGSMVGTVFIHLMANLLSVHYTGVRALLEPSSDAVELSTREVRLGFVQGGQTRDFTVHVRTRAGYTGELFSVVVRADSSPAVFSAVATSAAPLEPRGFASARAEFIAALDAALERAEAGDDVTATVQALHAALTATATADPRIAALCTDLVHADRARGQIEKAFARVAFERWGRHYVPCVLSGHRTQWAINFRDEGSKIYGGVATRALVDRGDEVFNSLPPPTRAVPHDLSAGAPSRGGHGGGGGGARGGARGGGGSGGAAAAAPMPRMSMARINSSSGPCFTGESTLELASGELVRLDALCAGQRVAGGALVRAVVRTEVAEMPIVRLGGAGQPAGGFTAWHPIRLNGVWVAPATVAHARVERVEAVYNLVLDRGHLVRVNGIDTCTLGHEFTSSRAVAHNYFGKRVPGVRHVLDDLAEADGWADGYVVLRQLAWLRGPDGRVTGMRHAKF